MQMVVGVRVVGVGSGRIIYQLYFLCISRIGVGVVLCKQALPQLPLVARMTQIANWKDYLYGAFWHLQ